MYIQTEDTPNPHSLKFIVDKVLLEPDASGRPALGVDFPTQDSADASPFVRSLFGVEGVVGVYLGSDFVTVTKSDDMEWAHLKPSILNQIADSLSAETPIFDGQSQQSSGPATNLDDYEGEDREVVEQIVELIDTRVRPAVAADGGDIVFRHYEPRTGVVFLSLHGACQGCPSSTMTLKSGIENLLKHYVPEVAKVEPVL